MTGVISIGGYTDPRTEVILGIGNAKKIIAIDLKGTAWNRKVIGILSRKLKQAG